MLIEASRRVSRAAVEEFRSVVMEFDRIAFKEAQVDVPAEQAFRVIEDGGSFVLSFDDPSVEPLEPDCGS